MSNASLPERLPSVNTSFYAYNALPVNVYKHGVQGEWGRMGLILSPNRAVSFRLPIGWCLGAMDDADNKNKKPSEDS